MARAIDANADDDAEAVARLGLAFDQNSGALLARQQEIVRPFEGERWRKRRRLGNDGIAQRQGRDKGELRRVLVGRRLAQQQARIEIAGGRSPGTVHPAAACGLGHRRDPQRRAFAPLRADAGFLIGRADGGEGFKPNTCLDRYRVKLHQNRECAAALATPTSGPG